MQCLDHLIFRFMMLLFEPVDKTSQDNILTEPAKDLSQVIY